MTNRACQILCSTLLCFSFMTTVHAADCFLPSPNFRHQGENYYRLDNTVRLSAEILDRLDDFYRKLQGNWQGRLEISECLGTESSPRKKVSEYSLTADINPGPDGSLLIKATRYDEQFKMKKILERVLLGKATPTFDLNISSPNQISFAEKYRLTNRKKSENKPVSSRLVENIIRLQLDHNNLTITIEQYINSFHVSVETWTLTGK